MIYVVGSGPSGVAAAAALLDEGRAVTILDVGETLSSSDEAPVHSNLEDPDRPLKRIYGSTFPYALKEMRGDLQHGTRCVQSFARGGLSNVWGAAVLPASARDREDWPLSGDALDRGYAAVARLMPIAGSDDDLVGEFPFYAPPQLPLRRSRQGAALLERLAARRDVLRRAGVTAGQSRLAVRSGACRYVGKCLVGCPEFAIWSAADALRELQSHARFRYQSGCRVDVVEADTAGRAVQIKAATSSGTESLTASRVLLACGPLATARIVLRSLRRYDEPFALRYQPYFLLPMLARRGIGGVESEALHTLAQAFVEIDDRSVSPHTVHLQFYGYNSFIGERVHRVAGLAGPFAGIVRDALNGRLMAVQGYFHSATANPITLVAKRAENDRARLELNAAPVPSAQIRKVVAFLSRHRAAFGALPISAMLEIGRPGDGNHCGGTFPMRLAPRPLESDIYGQLPQLPRVHLVDSSVLPSLPATTFTYTVMANADRIARAVARADAHI